MDYYQLIANSFQDTIETVASAVDTLALPIEQSSTAMTEALLAGGKIITVGLNGDAALATLLADTLLCNTEYERPALPALAMPASSSLDVAARQLRALVQPTDVVVIFATSPDNLTNATTLIAAATDGNARTVLVSNGLEIEYPDNADTVVISLGERKHARAVELATMVSCALGTLIENNLFGNFNEINE
ncbi:MAG: SIS domain-containing protein [Halioglobus sp.]